jgi:hypothetical protein
MEVSDESTIQQRLDLEGLTFICYSAQLQF